MTIEAPATSDADLFAGFKLFDSHLHIIDPRFPLIANQGFLPEAFGIDAYRHRLQNYNVAGGAVVSGSFQAFDQTYLLAALKQLGKQYVGVSQLPPSVTDAEILHLDKAGVRALRFNIARGGSAGIQHLSALAHRVYEIARWHIELYVSSNHLAELYPVLITLPAASIDHLGLTYEGFDVLLKLVERGMHVKATGFGRVDFDVKKVMTAIDAANPAALMFGTDLPSTRAPRAYQDDDFKLVLDTFGEEKAKRIFFDNAAKFYRVADRH